MKLCNPKVKKNKPSIPKNIIDNEKIVRSIFSPKNVNKSKNTILANAYRPPSGIDEVSVNRLDYTCETFCKKLSKKIAQPQYKKNYFGLGLHTAEKIRSTNSDVFYTPIKDINLFHSDIKIGFIPKKGEPLPSRFQKKVNDLAKCSKLFVDKDPNEPNWTGDSIQY